MNVEKAKGDRRYPVKQFVTEVDHDQVPIPNIRRADEPVDVRILLLLGSEGLERDILLCIFPVSLGHADIASLIEVAMAKLTVIAKGAFRRFPPRLERQ